jgi:2-hydroxychromene-2-carboxylate isomerase
VIARFYFSLRSPYSWLAWHDLLTGHPQLLERIDLRPFWEPDELSEKLLAEAGGRFLYTPMTKEKHLYILHDVRRLAAERGLSVVWPVDEVQPCWEVPHLAYLAAERRGVGPAFISAAYRTRWQQGRNICDPEVIGSLASELGMDPAQLSTAVDESSLRSAGAGRLLDLYVDSVFGVPYFRHGYQRYWGLDRFPLFVAGLSAEPAADRASGSSPSVATACVRATDWGHAGGCG